MIILCFGLPGTGKSTFTKKFKNRLVMDLGHNAFRNNEQRNKFYDKSKKTTSSIIDVISHTVNPTVKIYWDTYPEYFDLKTLVRYRSHIHVYIAIPPEEAMDNIVERVGVRDGRGEFYQLYKRSAQKWRSDWINLSKQWISMLGKKTVVTIPVYDDLK